MTELLRKLAGLAIAESEEIGGFITDRDLVVIPNIAVDRQHSYVPKLPIPPNATFWHSHQQGGFSEADIRALWHTNYPWLIFDKSTLTFHQYCDAKKSQYLNRPYLAGLQDCYCLVRDWYRFELNSNLPTPLFYLDGGNTIAQLIKAVLREYFYPVEGEIKAHDLCIWMDKGGIAHVGVAIEIDHQMQILHHPQGRVSQLINDLNAIEKCKLYRHKKLNLDSTASWGYCLELSLRSKQIVLEKSVRTAAIS
jgi:hypothetical protein